MRELLRRRHGERARLRLTTAAAALAAAAFAAAPRPTAESVTPVVRITSPLGRAGLPGTIRIVARLDAGEAEASTRVHFYVDGALLATDADGPPFEAQWKDDHPFEPRELVAEAELPTGALVRDRVMLPPLQITEAAEITSVAVDASVVDARGRFVRDLRGDEFQLFENDQPQQLDVVRETREPALFALLVDASQSMAMRADVVRATAARLIDNLAPEDQVVVAPFSRGITTVTGPTTDRATVLEAIGAIRPAGGTAILDAIREAAAALSGRERRRAVVLITDGYDEHSTAAIESAVSALRASDITLYVIGVGGVAGMSLKGERLLTTMAEETGGRAWFPRDERRVGELYAAATSDVQHRYLLTYTPANQRRDGGWRSIDVRVNRPGVRVRARRGYTAPLAPPVRASLEFSAETQEQSLVSLTRDDLEVLEDGVPQAVDTFQEAILGVTIMLALDSSGSMKRSAEQAKAAARDFVLSLGPEDEIGMIAFADRSNYIHSPTPRRDWSLKAIDGYVAAGGTALYDALYDALAQVSTVSGRRRVVVVVTDGRDEDASARGPGSRRTWAEVLQKLETSEATVYAVGVGARVDRERLDQLAKRSGGSAFFGTDAASLAPSYLRILDELRRRYVLGYESTNRLRDGRWRTVDVRARRPGVSIRSRGGYYAPAQ